jgi:hypothetical protein
MSRQKVPDTAENDAQRLGARSGKFSSMRGPAMACADGRVELELPRLSDAEV